MCAWCKSLQERQHTHDRICLAGLATKNPEVQELTFICDGKMAATTDSPFKFPCIYLWQWMGMSLMCLNFGNECDISHMLYIDQHQANWQASLHHELILKSVCVAECSTSAAGTHMISVTWVSTYAHACCVGFTLSDKEGPHTIYPNLVLIIV